MDVPVELTVNGEKRTVITDPERSLLEVLREELGLTGAKYSCGEGQCGACSVLLNGKRILSCITPLSSARDKSVVTIEGLASSDALHPVQDAFVEAGAIQCGYCTGGMIVAAVALLGETPSPSTEDVVAGMNRNICRCNGYPKIVSAVRRAAEKMKR